MSKAEDIALVSQVILLGSERAFRRLVDKYQASVRSFFLSHTCGDSPTSDDLAQETFIKVWTNIASFKGLAAFSTWLYSIAYRVLCDHYRSRKEMETLDATKADLFYQDEQPDLADEYDLYAALKRLNPDERTCILLFYREDLTVARISVITGMPLGTVKSHLSRAKTKMANFLNKQGYEYEKRSGSTGIPSEREVCRAF
ncbi:MAG: RNA polymerase sigma factor [Bacteroidales bacterium]